MTNVPALARFYSQRGLSSAFRTSMASASTSCCPPPPLRVMSPWLSRTLAPSQFRIGIFDKKKMVLPGSRRSFHWSALAEPISWIEMSLRGLHNLPIVEGGIPYWAAIVSLTILLRTCVTLPIALKQRSRQQQYKSLAPIIKSWENTYRNQISIEGSNKDGSYEGFRRRLQPLVGLSLFLGDFDRFGVLTSICVR